VQIVPSSSAYYAPASSVMLIGLKDGDKSLMMCAFV